MARDSSWSMYFTQFGISRQMPTTGGKFVGISRDRPGPGGISRFQGWGCLRIPALRKASLNSVLICSFDFPVVETVAAPFGSFGSAPCFGRPPTGRGLEISLRAASFQSPSIPRISGAGPGGLRGLVCFFYIAALMARRLNRSAAWPVASTILSAQPPWASRAASQRRSGRLERAASSIPYKCPASPSGRRS
jgi:hypothetical protein